MRKNIDDITRSFIAYFCHDRPQVKMPLSDKEYIRIDNKISLTIEEISYSAEEDDPFPIRILVVVKRECSQRKDKNELLKASSIIYLDDQLDLITLDIYKDSLSITL